MVFLNVYNDDNLYLNDKERIKELTSHISLVGDEVIYKSIIKLGDKDDFKLYGAYTNNEIQELFVTYPLLTTLDITDAIIIDNLSIPTKSNCLVYTNISYNLPKNEVINGICANFVLLDGYPINIIKEIKIENANYSRNAYCDGGWESIILPYDVDTLPENFIFNKYSHIDSNTGKIIFNNITSLKANTAYIFRYTGSDASSTKREIINFNNTNKTIITCPIKENFEGVYFKTMVAGKYILGLTTNGDVIFGLGGSKAYVAPFRAFLNNNK